MWVIIAVLALCMITCGVGAFFLKGAVDAIMPVGGCLVTGDMAAKSALAYAIEHDGRLPSAETWQDDIQPYYERLYSKVEPQLDDIPKVLNFKVSLPGELFECEFKDGPNTGFAFNAALSGVLVEDIESPHTVILVFETLEYGYNANGDPSTRPEDHPVLMLGKERPWIDIYATGQGDPLQSDNEDFNINYSIEDALSDPEPEPDERDEPE